jgi:hypothetical protein
MTLIAIWAFITANPAIVTLSTAAIFELIARRKPTKRDWSIINLIKFIVDAIIKNRNKNGSAHL